MSSYQYRQLALAFWLAQCSSTQSADYYDVTTDSHTHTHSSTSPADSLYITTQVIRHLANPSFLHAIMYAIPPKPV